MAHQQDIFHPGSRIGVLLVHGLAGTPKEMNSVGQRLNRFGFTVSIPVLKGHCADTPTLLDSGSRDWEETVEEAYLRLAEKTDVVFAGGLSAGALLSILLARRHPEVRGLTLYSTTLNWDGWAVPKLACLLPLLLRISLFYNRFRFSEAFPYGIKNEGLRERIMAKLQSGDSSAAGHTDTPGHTLAEMIKLIDAVKRNLPQVATPALIVHAEEDDMVSIKSALYVQKHIGGDSELLRLKNSYHLVTVDQELVLVTRATARFFRDRLSEAERDELASAATKALA